MKKKDQLRVSAEFIKKLETLGLTEEQITGLRNMDRESATQWIKEFLPFYP